MKYIVLSRDQQQYPPGIPSPLSSLKDTNYRQRVRFTQKQAVVSINSSSSSPLNGKQAAAAAAADDPTFPLPRTPTHHACDDYQGIYHIEITDELGGVGTAFFQLIIGQLLYAERHNLKPWIHLSNFSKVFYDDQVHGVGPGAQFDMKGRATVPYTHRPHGHRRDQTPGPPDFSVSSKKSYNFAGTGVWEHYFEPVSDFVPGDKSCINKNYVTMDLYLITPGIHGYDTELATRCWRYDYLPDYISQPHVPLHEWLEPQRRRAHDVIQRYFRFRPYLMEAAARVNPDCDNRHLCLGLHIRHSDKAAGRVVVPVADFVPYVDAFFRAGGDFLYVATDSSAVIDEVQQSWPVAWTSRMRTLGNDVTRSTNRTAVFDLASHHRTNQEVLVEILALAKCQFLVHGLSAVSETSIWINLKQHNRSVNLEDDGQHISALDFERVVSWTKQGVSDEQLPQPLRTDKWWDALTPNATLTLQTSTKESTCDKYHGVLIISEVGEHDIMVDDIFFVSVLNQLALAERLNLKPVVALDRKQVGLAYDGRAHETNQIRWSVVKGEVGQDGCPVLPNKEIPAEDLVVEASSVWGTYIRGWGPGSGDCGGEKPAYWLDAQTIQSTVQKCSWGLRYRPPDEKSSMWNPQSKPWNVYLRHSRREAGAVVSKYMEFHPVFHKKAAEANPLGSSDSEMCIGVVFQMTRDRKHGVTAENYLPYLRAFVQYYNGPIYVATDSSKPLRYMTKNFPPEITQRFRTQGPMAALSPTPDTALHMMDGHHRINSEMLVDVLALAKCRFLLHTSNSMAEAALYLSSIDTYSINLEDPHRPLPTDMKTALGTAAQSSQRVIVSEDDDFVSLDVSGAFVLSRKSKQGFAHSKNAIVYLAQKKHSTYGRDSYETLIRSLRLLKENYLQRHMNNTDVFIFHVASFTKDDLTTIENLLGPDAHGAVRLIDLDQSFFWGRPSLLQESDPSTWYAYPLFAEGYRHMIQFFAIHIWEFFERLNQAAASRYRYIMRLDEDSFLHSLIDYDLFKFMESQEFVYGYRMCSYEMASAQRMWKRYQQARGRAHIPKRSLETQGCGFYNNFFVADLSFFRRSDVQDFLQFIYERGHIYTWLLGDLMIHTMTIYKFADSSQVHRFLDFTYEHGTVDNTTGCLVWGGMQAGYNDDNATIRLERYYKERAKGGQCPLNQTSLSTSDLSPTYSHLPLGMESVTLQTVAAGRVELEGKGLLSG